MLEYNIYLDHSATTPVDSRVLAEMMPYFSETYGNASSQHWYGRKALEGIDIARKKVAKAIGAKSQSEIYFTSGGTESDNWAIKGVAEAYADKGNHIISTVVEHPAVIKTLQSLAKTGFDITYLPVNEEGLINVADLEKAITDKTILITVMAANNEIGTLFPLKEIGAIAKTHNIIFHTDAVQGIGSMHIDVVAMNIDLLSLSGHKIYAPKGVGALYKSNKIRLAKFMSGGEQERSQRAGTLNSPAIVGLGKAIELATEELDANLSYISSLRNRFVELIEETIDNVYLNGTRDYAKRMASNANFSFEFIEGESLLLRLDLQGIAVSSGSACSSGSLEPSYVLLATGRAIELAHGSIRFSFGKNNTMEEVEYTARKLLNIVDSLRQMSPLFKKMDGGKYV